MMAPSSVLRRINDQLVAPRASRGELLVAYATALACRAGAVRQAARVAIARALAPAPSILVLDEAVSASYT